MQNTFRTGLIVPTLNAGSLWREWLQALENQTLQPDFRLLIDSSSTDDTRELAQIHGFEILQIERAEFDHGGTRLMGARKMEQADILFFLTQDAILANENSLEKLLACFDDPQVASAYGKQLPSSGATQLAAHHRQYNYAEKSFETNRGNRAARGIRGLFCSNSFAAYRRDPLLAVGGFPAHLIMGEDMLAAGALIDAGYTHRYCADACVRHSHNFSLPGELRRFFDTGVFHAEKPEIRSLIASTHSEGAGFVRSELSYSLRRGPLLFVESVVRSALRAIGYYGGLSHRLLPGKLKMHLSNSKAYWEREYKARNKQTGVNQQ